MALSLVEMHDVIDASCYSGCFGIDYVKMAASAYVLKLL